jgi:Rho GTPase-activating protein 12/27
LIGKKQLNQLITLLDKEGGIRGSSRNAENALRSVRAKREAEEAGVPITLMNPYFITELELDKDYRKAVHWLETLRIRRVKTLEGGYNVSDTLCDAVDRYHKYRLHRA